MGVSWRWCWPGHVAFLSCPASAMVGHGHLQAMVGGSVHCHFQQASILPVLIERGSFYDGGKRRGCRWVPFPSRKQGMRV